MKRVLALGSHYDDVEIGVGGTLLKHRMSGDEIFIAIVDSDEYRTGSIDVRYKEQIMALHVLGIDEASLILFKATDDISETIGVLDMLRPDIVYTMFEFDTHQAHRKCSYIGQSVGRNLPTQVVFYNSGTAYDFLPNAFSIISFGFKQELLDCFRSQIELNAVSINLIKRRESYWASLITDNSNSYAEGFIIRKMLYEVK